MIEWNKSDTYMLIQIVWVHLYKIYKQIKLTYYVGSQGGSFFYSEHEKSFEIL